MKNKPFETSFNSIVEAVLSHAERQPDKFCLADDQKNISYREYAELIMQYACVLSRYHVTNSDCVVVEASQTVDYLATELALHLLGAVFVPVENRCTAETIVKTASSCNARLFIAVKDKNKEEIGSLLCRTMEELADEAKTVSIQKKEPEYPHPDKVSEILFSTGTTGKEKGIVLNHRSSIALAKNVINGVEIEEDNVEMIPSPLNHSHGLRRYYANMVRGSSVVLISSIMNMKQFFRQLEQYHVTAVDLVPSALSILLRLSGNRMGQYDGQIRYLQFGAAPLAESNKKRVCELLPHARLYNFYGSTESGCVAVYNFNNGYDKPHCIGKPTCCAEIFLADEDGNELPIETGKTGLLSVRGDMNMVEYWNDPEETAKALRQGCVYTADEAYFDRDQDIILLGRKGDVINVGGSKVSPEEIEEAAHALNGICDCGCVPRADDMKGQVPVLYVQMEKSAAFDPVSIRRQLQKTLEPYKMPVQIIQMEKIPRSFNGKLLRRELLSVGRVEK